MLAEIEIRYACHCYTEAAYLEPDEGSWSVRERNEWRVFNKARHAFSLHLPPMIVGLVQNPKKPIQKVSGRHNFKMFHLTVPGLNPGERYYAFLKLEKTARVGAEGHHQVRLSVESAYPRQDVVSSNWNPPFGRAIEGVLGLR